MARRNNRVEFLIRLRDEFSRKLDEADKKFRDFTETVRKNAKKITVAVGAAVATLVALVRPIVRAGLAMERLQRTFNVATGSIEGSRREVEFLIERSKQLGLDLAVVGEQYGRLTAAARGTTIAGQGARDIFVAVSEAAVALGLSAEQSGGALVAIEQIISKGKVSAEELRGQLGERLPGAFQIAARAIGKTTQELDEMLRKGELTADELLPALARELHNTFGEEAVNAADDAQAAINRLNTAIFELQVAIAESGVLDALAAMANSLANIISPGLNQRINETSAEIKRLKEEIEQFENLRLRFPNNPSSQNEIDKRRTQLAELNAVMDELLMKQGRLVAGPIVEGDVTPAGGSGDAETHPLQRWLDSFDTAEVEFDKQITKLNKAIADGLIPSEEDRQRIRQILVDSILNDGLDEIEVTSKRRVAKLRDMFDPMLEAAKQAARNMQDAFAEFFFDPFEDGLKGLLASFINVIRRMISQMLALKTMKIFNLGNIFKSFGFGGLADGGPGSGLTMVGERGPELVNLPRGSRVLNNSASKTAARGGMGDAEFHSHIDARGADPGLIARLPQIMEQRDRMLLNAVARFMETGEMPV